MGKHTEGKHAAPPVNKVANQFQPSYSAPSSMGGVAPAFNMGDDRRSRNRRGLKIFGIVMGVIIGLLLVAYIGGAIVFMGRFFPNTSIADTDISMNSPEEVADMLDHMIEGYSVEVVGQGISTTLTAKDAGMTLDSDKIAATMMGDVNPWAWPLEIFSEHDETEALVASYAATGLSESMSEIVAAVNESAEPPVDATIAYSEEAGCFDIVPEVQGTMLDLDKVVAEIAEGATTLQPKVTLTSDVLVMPAVFKDDPRLSQAKDEANALIQADIDLMMDGNLVTEATPALIASWVTITPEITVAFDDASFSAWIDEIIAGCNTVGTERTYTRPDGKVVTVSGGSYGWEVDDAALREMVTEGVRSGTVGALDIPVIQSGNGFSGLGSQDWGARYCDVDLSEQYARFYDSEGSLVWETDIITGAPGKHATPTGVYSITWGMESPSKLIGEKDPETGKPEYETVVQYWMPFVGNAIGLHDADWQPAFGGSLYSQGYGSHGCVNLPVSKARDLYGMIEIGDVVVVHW